MVLVYVLLGCFHTSLDLYYIPLLYKVEHNECQVLTFEGLSATFEGSMNVSYNKNLLTFITIGDKQYT